MISWAHGLNPAMEGVLDMLLPFGMQGIRRLLNRQQMA